jgi:hypothetical protein
MKARVRSALLLLSALVPVHADPPGAVERLLMAGGFVGTVNEDAGSPVNRVELGREATDADLADLCELRQLDSLYLRQTRVSEDGLRIVAQLPQLRRLGLCGENITDAGLRRLEAMQGLEERQLFKCPNITEEGLARLRKALPGCTIHRR